MDLHTSIKAFVASHNATAKDGDKISMSAFTDACLAYVMGEKERRNAVLAATSRKVGKADLVSQIAALQARLAEATATTVPERKPAK